MSSNSDLQSKGIRAAKKRLGYALAGIIALILLAAGYSFRQLGQSIRNSYAVWWVADMVVEHMKVNDGHWPTCWEHLRDDYQTCVKRSGQPWTFDELSQRVLVDWQADPQQLLAQSKDDEAAEFRVITLSDGTTSHWESNEPNQIILDYLRSVATADASDRSSTEK